MGSIISDYISVWGRCSIKEAVLVYHVRCLMYSAFHSVFQWEIQLDCLVLCEKTSVRHQVRRVYVGIFFQSTYYWFCWNIINVFFFFTSDSVRCCRRLEKKTKEGDWHLGKICLIFSLLFWGNMTEKKKTTQQQDNQPNSHMERCVLHGWWWRHASKRGSLLSRDGKRVFISQLMSRKDF